MIFSQHFGTASGKRERRIGNHSGMVYTVDHAQKKSGKIGFGTAAIKFQGEILLSRRTDNAVHQIRSQAVGVFRQKTVDGRTAFAPVERRLAVGLVAHAHGGALYQLAGLRFDNGMFIGILAQRT